MRLTTLRQARPAALLTGAVAVTSFVTGILHIGTPVSTGPFGWAVPLWLQEVAGFTGAVTGFVLAISAVGLLRQYRTAWYAALVFVPLSGVQAALQSSVASFPLIVLSVLTVAVLGWSRSRFTTTTNLSPTQIAALLAVIGSQVYGTAGAYALRHQFNQSLTVFDAFYYSVVTASTVGYGDIVPVTISSRLFAVSLIAVGTGSFAAFIGTFVLPAVEKHVVSRVAKTRRSRNSTETAT